MLFTDDNGKSFTLIQSGHPQFTRGRSSSLLECAQAQPRLCLTISSFPCLNDFRLRGVETGLHLSSDFKLNGRYSTFIRCSSLLPAWLLLLVPQQQFIRYQYQLWLIIIVDFYNQLALIIFIQKDKCRCRPNTGTNNRRASGAIIQRKQVSRFQFFYLGDKPSSIRKKVQDCTLRISRLYGLCFPAMRSANPTERVEMRSQPPP